MEATCIGAENKDNITDLNFKIRLLEQEIEHIKTNMVTVSTLHELQLEMNEIKMSLQELQNDRMEDRKQLGHMRHTIDELSSKMEEYLQESGIIIGKQNVVEEKQDRMDKTMNELVEEVKALNVTMNRKFEESKLSSQFKTFYNKSKFHKFLSIFAIGMGVVLFISILAFFTSGGETFFDIMRKFLGFLTNVKEVIT